MCQPVAHLGNETGVEAGVVLRAGITLLPRAAWPWEPLTLGGNDVMVFLEGGKKQSYRGNGFFFFWEKSLAFALCSYCNIQ